MMISTTRRRAAALAGAGLLAVSVAACTQTNPGGGGDGGDGGGGGGTLAQLQESGTVTLGIAGERPYSYMEDGEPTGATVAIAEEIYGQLGIDNVDAQVVAWDSLIPGLNAGRFDMVSAGMSILPDRCEQAAFANPTIMYTTGLLVPEGNPMNLNDLQDVKESGAKLAVLSGAIEDGYAEDMGIEGTLQLQNAEDGLDAVVTGRADVFALTAISLEALAEANADAPVEATEPFIAIVNGTEQLGAGAAVFRPGDSELLEAWNSELDKIVGSEQKYEEVLGEFGFGEPWRPPSDLTTEQLCQNELPETDKTEAVPDEG